MPSASVGNTTCECWGGNGFSLSAQCTRTPLTGLIAIITLHIYQHCRRSAQLAALIRACFFGIELGPTTELGVERPSFALPHRYAAATTAGDLGCRFVILLLPVCPASELLSRGIPFCQRYHYRDTVSTPQASHLPVIRSGWLAPHAHASETESRRTIFLARTCVAVAKLVEEAKKISEAKSAK
eukprot:IDg11154t1